MHDVFDPPTIPALPAVDAGHPTLALLGIGPWFSSLAGKPPRMTKCVAIRALLFPRALFFIFRGALGASGRWFSVLLGRGLVALGCVFALPAGFPASLGVPRFPVLGVGWPRLCRWKY